MADPQDVVARLNQCLNDKDLDGARRVYAAGARMVTSGGRHIDLEGHDRILQATFSAFPDLSLTTVRTVCEGDTVVTEEVMEGTHIGHFAGLAPTGKRVHMPLVHVTRVLGDRIVERVAYHD